MAQKKRFLKWIFAGLVVLIGLASLSHLAGPSEEEQEEMAVKIASYVNNLNKGEGLGCSGIVRAELIRNEYILHLLLARGAKWDVVGTDPKYSVVSVWVPKPFWGKLTHQDKESFLKLVFLDIKQMTNDESHEVNIRDLRLGEVLAKASGFGVKVDH